MISPIKPSMIVLLCCGMVQAAVSQSLPLEQPARVERSSFCVQAGLVSLFVNHELGLTDQLTLRTELGVQGALYILHVGFGLGLTVSAIVEPRGYYNLTKRKEQGKFIAGNSGNFVALRMHYARSGILWRAIRGANFISIAPMWGIRRNLGPHFNYEFAVGAGWQKIIEKSGDFDYMVFIPYRSYDPISLYLHLRIGYRF